ncbi:D-alanyl-D-alanine carboxypeptidase [Bifidobacterium sp. ESL0790]|uniref:D-alanyl-D-alanine carboxypeptidase/D-alanyl-D-alanine-endopeptidase n=1 Tax=Bifidobacterium sp. ESL0790 TaxID=2983233 RepID=UPI0023F6FA69|nr:D-alanyl-D-alanine carboxypeptidase [Bifidobacterium sp. ESL0790]WEV72015.1 D-alanyl-D-alanine carboxypeptidase [Bifidobacterium sp. ESL0790]
MMEQGSGKGRHAQHSARSVGARRNWRIVVSALVTLALFAGYVVADIYDKVPGSLTLSNGTGSRAQTLDEVREAKDVAGAADLGKPIDKQGVEAAISALGAAPGVGSDFSVAVADAHGTIVASQNDGTPREPASTMKTLTALAASTTLDMGSTFSTEAWLDPSSVHDGSGVVTLKGDGDMLLGAGENDPSHINGRAGLASLADQTAQSLKARKISKIKLRYDDALFGETRYPENIAENNDGNMEYTAVSSMAVDGGRQWGGYGPDDPDTYTAYPPMSTTPTQDAAATFAQLLAARGITVDGDATKGSAAKGSARLGAVRSATLSQVLAFTLRHSDNTLAEEFGRLTALKLGLANSPEGATKAVAAQVTKAGVDTTGLTMADCSGLSPGSKVGVKTLVEVQAHNLQPGNGAAAAEGLSMPGLVGTARNRIEDVDDAGLLRVKTGSLDEVTSMAGNVSRKGGGVLAFAVVVNNPQDLLAARNAIDALVAAMDKL